jgi:8-oxo-dGTP diphosphatase
MPANVRREYPEAPLIGVGAVIVHDARVVLARRANHPSAGEWSIPGGLVHLGETLTEAVIREAYEETCLHVEPQCLVELVERIFPDENGKIRHHYILADYYCIVTGGTLRAASDATEVAWVHSSELDYFNLAPITLQVIQKTLEMKKDLAAGTED